MVNRVSAQNEDMAPLQSADEAPLGDRPRIAWSAEETVPLLAAAKHVESEERAKRLRLVTGQRRRP